MNKRILLFGGGGSHDFKTICPLLNDRFATAGGFAVDYVDGDCDVFRSERFAPYDAAVVYHTGGQLPLESKRGLIEGVADGKGFVGIHGAADSFSHSPEYRAMLGGHFRAHPFVREYIVSLADTGHPVTRGIAGYSVKDWEKWPVHEYKVTDEQYLLDYDPRVHLLATTVFRGRTWPVAWAKTWGKGRVCYLALGHNIEACRNPFFQQFLINAVRWASEPEAETKPEPDPRFAIS